MKPINFQKLHYRMSFMIRHIGRLELLSFFFIFIAVVLLAAAFRYTIVDGDYYRNLADRQQTAKITNSVSRGSIYTKNEPIGVLATSADLPDLAIDPTASGSHEALLDFLVQVYRREACGIAFDLSCVERSYELMRMPLAQGTKITSQGLDGSIRTFIQSKLSQEYVTSSLLKENLTPQELDTFSKFSATNLVGSGMYLIANNVYVNPMTLSLSDDQKKNLQDMFGLTGADMAKSLLQRKVRYIKILSQMSFATKEFVDERLAQSAENGI
jgi:cell division protein FtsI/penicillin-binding protein 2